MNLKYWEWEAQPVKEKLKAPSIRHLADILFENDTHKYRFCRAMLFVKEKGIARLSDMPNDLPKATWLRYLEYATQLGLLDKTTSGYALTNRFSTPLRNLAEWYEKWRKRGEAEDAGVLFPLAKKKNVGGSPSVA
ncbi:MAG: hypothetical protein NTY90_02965 [Candidatus Micrarchaeota archaeon]|nr:hypothetical protein [Candidatus Micrarchaeota archaeon]